MAPHGFIVMRSCLCGYFEVARIFFRGDNLIKTKDRKFCKGGIIEMISQRQEALRMWEAMSVLQNVWILENICFS